MDLILKTVALVRFLKAKKYPEIKRLFGSLIGIEAGRASMPVHGKIPVHSLLNFQFLKTLPLPWLSNYKSPNFRHLLTFTCSLHFWNLQRANIRFSIYSRSMKRVDYSAMLFRILSPLTDSVKFKLYTIFL